MRSARTRCECVVRPGVASTRARSRATVTVSRYELVEERRAGRRSTASMWLQVARVQQELLVVAVLDRARQLRPGRGVSALHEPLDDREQLERAERLADERLGAGALRLPRLVDVGAGRAGRSGSRSSPAPT